MPNSLLNPAQQEAVKYDAGPSLIIAGAGTGKTKTLISKIAKLIEKGYTPNRILAVTFTNKAAGEMRERIEKLVPGSSRKVWLHTFHAFGMRMIRQHPEQVGLTRDFFIYGESEQKTLIKNILEEMGFKDDKKNANYYLSVISRAKDDMVNSEDFAKNALASRNDKKIFVSKIYTKYQNKLNQANAMDFGDILVKTYELLTKNENLKKYYQDYFQYILIDEYQDTNHVQYLITKILAEKHRKLCVVGDPDQSIYSWRGANIRNILEFEKDFKDSKTITLEQNYRSTQKILSASNKLIKSNLNRKAKNLFTEKNSGDDICVKELLSEREEAKWVAHEITRFIDEEGASLNDIAIFYRTNMQSRNFEDSFRKLQIPYRLIGAVKFYDRREIKDIISYARLLINPKDNISLLRIINQPRRGLGKTSLDKFINYANLNNLSIFSAMENEAYVENVTPTARRGVLEFVKIMKKLTLEAGLIKPSDLMGRILSLSGYWQFLENNIEKEPENASRLGNLQELINAVKEYEERCEPEGKEPSLSDYLQEVALITSQDELSAGEGAVTLMTVHLAKGLEFPVVFVTGLEEGLFPLMGKEADDLEEERRLCYVAMTRAEEKLHMSCSSTRRIFGKMYSNIPSRFLFESDLMTHQAHKQIDEMEARKKRASSYTKTYFKPNTSREVSSQQPSSRPEPVASSGKQIRIGSRVKHGVFGEGKVLSVTGSGESTKINVIFPAGVRRTFMLSFAPLEIL
ncbi:MAG: UvrD-helicase domain-containing protein [Elusimicrobiaceae bacterium]|nr:UvrD-helicase domain-containing protein [Elusimicrobiaceae bacterium]MBT3955443.1 UvrD-helicase domain-containing protein [Elusimicrobiaceae bacterium]MBT4008619.1 UvrD-helicase domain-containing protein [Elusimicrobiaceae bacterium]MBT4439722.1 UvrD-helicase domain-containing protein [Elusimicrobiaceae bacterium]MBT5987017.1 UvrD-helicase domain-containing protein [Elusimicrobiaceae bacterium]